MNNQQFLAQVLVFWVGTCYAQFLNKTPVPTQLPLAPLDAGNAGSTSGQSVEQLDSVNALLHDSSAHNTSGQSVEQLDPVDRRPQQKMAFEGAIAESSDAEIEVSAHKEGYPLSMKTVMMKNKCCTHQKCCMCKGSDGWLGAVYSSSGMHEGCQPRSSSTLMCDMSCYTGICDSAIKAMSTEAMLCWQDCSCNAIFFG